MLHLGDITKIKGSDAPVVDVIIGGSPCQDLSVAGKRAGLAGERSGLYMEQIRIIKEMREADVLRGKSDVDIRPRYMVWENVPGAFSSNGGKDFAAVLEEAIRVAEPEAPAVRVPEKGWPTSGCFWDELGRWSVAWRVLDAQFWGTSDKPLPQRRRRIALVADFGGLSASEILFVRQSVSGDIEPGEPKRKETAGDAGESSGGADKGCLNGWDCQSKRVFSPEMVCATLNSGTTEGINIVPSVMVPSVAVSKAVDSHILDDQGGSQISVRSDGKCPTLRAEMHGNIPAVMELHSYEKKAFGKYAETGKASTLKSRDFKDATDLVVNTEPVLLESNQNHATVQMNGVCTTLPASMGMGGGYVPMVCKCRHIVRRLTPLECERLQGYPDGWTDIGEWVDSKGKVHKPADSPRYKALGNSIAIPPWKWVLKRLCACYERDATMASLFDGIGGFPYIWEQLNGKGSCLWASEIEEFPMAVTKLRFGGNDYDA